MFPSTPRILSGKIDKEGMNGGSSHTRSTRAGFSFLLKCCYGVLCAEGMYRLLALAYTCPKSPGLFWGPGGMGGKATV